MNNTTTLGTGTYYTLKDKFFWASFLNLARHNSYITLNYIQQQLGLQAIENDQDLLIVKGLWNSDGFTNNLVKKAKLQQLILKHFPFILPASYGKQSHNVYESLPTGNNDKKRDRTIGEKQTEQSETFELENIKEQLFLFLEKLRDLRNYYSHYCHSKQLEIPALEKELCERLYNILSANIQLVKQDHKLNPTIDPHKDFEHLIRKGRNNSDNPKFKAKLSNDKEFTEAGLLFFTSLFLEKKDAIWMQKKIRGFKGGDVAFKQMTNEVFCRSRMLLPKLRLESTYDADKMLLDMLNELGRCPMVLYERLQESDREKFNVPVETIEEDETEDDLFKNKLIRHQNRFPYFAMRFFDLKELLPNLRFQVDLGTYHFSVYDKMIGTQLEKRHLTRTLYGFGRMQQYDERLQPAEWKALVKDLDYNESSDLPFISKTTPHYNLEQNKIGLKFVYKADNPWPAVKVEQKPNGMHRYRHNGNFTADAFMSVHELLPMIFYYMLTNDGSKVENIIKTTLNTVFTVYADFQAGSINTIDDLEQRIAGTNLVQGHFPKQMLALLRNEQKNIENLAKQKQEKLIADTEKRIDKLKEQFTEKIKIGKRKSGLLKSGIIADWLVKDMMRYQPVETNNQNEILTRSKANSTEFQLLQRTFALYGGEKDRLPAYFNQMHLVNANNAHPFLSRFAWDKQPNILAFYDKYLNAKLNFLKQLKPSDWQKNEYFLLLKIPKTNRKTLSAGWKNGFNLPRGLFTEAIRQYCATHETATLKDKIKDLDRAGFIAKTIPLFFKERYNDDVPAYYFYDMNVGSLTKKDEVVYRNQAERETLLVENRKNLQNNIGDVPVDKAKEILETTLKAVAADANRKNWNAVKIKLQTLAEQFNMQTRNSNLLSGSINLYQVRKEMENYVDIHRKKYIYFKQWQHFEKELRMYKNQDRMMWLMCRALFTDSQMGRLQKTDLKLRDLETNTNNNNSLNILNTIVPMKLPITIYPMDDKGNILKQQQPLRTLYIEERNTNLLKQGNFKALVKDRRINGLFAYVCVQDKDAENFPISKIRLDYELANYQTTRIQIFRILLDIEQRLLRKNSSLPTDNFRKMMEQWLKNHLHLQTDLQPVVQSLIALRNAVSHNQYPGCQAQFAERIRPFYPDHTTVEEKHGLNIARQLADYTAELQTIIKEYI